MTSTALMSKPAVAARNRWFSLAVLLAGAFMALLDTTIVNVAIPTIRTSIGASNATLSWIVSGYALAFGLALIPAGRVGDRFGHKWVFVAGLALFTVASLACGLAQGDGELIAARAVQGLAGGMFFTHVDSWSPTGAALAFGHSATIAMAVSAALSVVAFALVFVLPQRMSNVDG